MGQSKSRRFKITYNLNYVCKTVSYQQEFWLVSQRLDSDWTKNKIFLNKGLEMKNPILIKFHEELFEKYQFVPKNNLYWCDEVKSCGFSYKLDDYLIIKDNLDIKENAFGKIIKIYVVDGSPVLGLSLYDIKGYIKTRNCLTTIFGSFNNYFFVLAILWIRRKIQFVWSTINLSFTIVSGLRTSILQNAKWLVYKMFFSIVYLALLV